MESLKPWIEDNIGVRQMVLSSGVTEATLEDWLLKADQYFDSRVTAFPSNQDRLRLNQRKFAIHTFLVQDWGTVLGLNRTEILFFGFVLNWYLMGHDLGRIKEMETAGTAENPTPPYGLVSATAFRGLFPGLAQEPLGALVNELLKHSSDVCPLEFDDVEEVDKKVSWGFITLVHDLASQIRFKAARKLVSDEDAKRFLRKAFLFREMESNGTYGSEQGVILPESITTTLVVRSFLRRGWVSIRSCQTYEALILHLLAELNDIANQEIFELIVKEGGPAIVMDYLSNQLAKTEVGAEQLRLISDWYEKVINETDPPL